MVTAENRDHRRLGMSHVEKDTEGEENNDGEDGDDGLAQILRARSARWKAVEDAHSPLSAQNGKRRPLPAPLPTPLPAAPPSPRGNTTPEFVQKRRLAACSRWRVDHPLDFVFENPLDGKFKNLPCVVKLLADHPHTVKQKSTSYCHYSYDYRKRTVFVTSLVAFCPAPPCPGNPCAHVRSGNSHPSQVTDYGAAQKNSLPPALIDLLVESWLQRRGPSWRHLVVDVFSGWGSLGRRVAEKQRGGEWSEIAGVYCNDIVQREFNHSTLDMSVVPVSVLLAFAVAHFFPDTTQETSSNELLSWLQCQKIAVLLHFSTPCDTYSTVGLRSHRVGDTLEAKTALARSHDAMNAQLVSYCASVCLG